MSRVAAIDIGTNTLLLLIAERQHNGTWTAIRDECHFGRLGKGVDTKGVLDPTTIENSLHILKQYRTYIDTANVDAVAAVGTQALREASNAAAFVGPASSILNTQLEVIGGHREAELVHIAVNHSLPQLQGQSYAIADVGGGSTEVIVCTSGTVHSVKSLPIGSVRLTERCFQSDPPSPSEVQSLYAEIDAAIATLSLPPDILLVGSAGTATTIASVALGLKSYEPEQIHGFHVSQRTVEEHLQRYIRLPLAERRTIRGLESERADVIAAGIAIYARLLHKLGGEMVISDRGVRWGLVYEMESKCP